LTVDGVDGLPLAPAEDGENTADVEADSDEDEDDVEANDVEAEAENFWPRPPNKMPIRGPRKFNAQKAKC
jgi:hypothetical protein